MATVNEFRAAVRPDMEFSEIETGGGIVAAS